MGMTGTWINCRRAKRAALSAAGFALALLSSGAASAENACDWYAKTAVRQQQINETQKCGLTGEGWHKDFARHLAHCQSVAPDVWKADARKRNDQLTACEKKG